MSYGLTSPVPVLRLLMAQSNCFRVVDRGRASSALARERQMARGGELQKGSHMGSGQMVAADYIITPTILRKNEDAGGAFGGLGGLLPGAAGAIAGGLKTHELQAEVLLTATNVRTGVQEAVAQGSASKSDVSWGGGGWAGPVAGLGGSYESTDIGKITAAAFLDAHNKLARQLGAIPVNSAATADNAGWYTSRRLNLRGGPNTRAPVIKTLPKGASVMPTGAKSGPWWEVDAAGQQGWVHSDYLTR
jgi:curli biogenesis system outer membrane secretion channel CsgG